MKYKLLIVDRSSTLTKDFMVHASDYFNCISSSNLESDVIKHIKLFKPDASIYFMDTYSGPQISALRSHKDEHKRYDIPIIVIGNDEVCEKLQSKTGSLVDLIIQRPISADNMTLIIEKFLDKYKSEQTESVLAKNIIIPENSNGRKSILVVDDDRSILKLLKVGLGEEYEVTSVINGALVEKFVETKPCDLIILDYEMPLMTGYQVFKQLKSKPISMDIPVIFLTGLTESDKIKQIMELKPDGYLLKPVMMDMLISAVHNVLKD